MSNFTCALSNAYEQIVFYLRHMWISTFETGLSGSAMNRFAMHKADEDRLKKNFLPGQA